MGWQVIYVPFLEAGGTIINQNGIFVYNGTPALGNLKVSIAAAAGVDDFGNTYTDNVATYDTAGFGYGYAQLASNPSTGLPYLVLSPPGGINVNAFPQVNASVLNAGLVNEQTQINVVSGNEVAQGAAGQSLLQLVSRPNNGGTSLAKLFADLAQVVLSDGNTYFFGENTLTLGSGVAISSTTFVNVWSFNLGVGTYRIKTKIVFLPTSSTGALSVRYTNTATLSNAGGDGFWKNGTTVANSFIYNGVSNFGNVASMAGTQTSGQLVAYEADVQVIVSVAGTINIQAAGSIAGATGTISSNSFVDYWPINL